MLANDDLVWASWQFIAELKNPTIRRSIEIIVPMSQKERKITCNAISTTVKTKL
jgi:hypothetical protein